MLRIRLAMVPYSAGVITKQLVAATIQSVTTFLAQVGFDSEHVPKKKYPQTLKAKSFTSDDIELTAVKSESVYEMREQPRQQRLRFLCNGEHFVDFKRGQVLGIAFISNDAYGCTWYF